MWEVAIKTMYIPWGSLALPKPQAFLGTKFTASSLPKEEGWRFTLRGSWIVGHLPSVSGYRQHSDRWLVAEVSDYESFFSLLLLDKHTAKWDCFASRYRFPDISEIFLNISQLFYFVGLSMRIIALTDCLPVYHYNYLICIFVHANNWYIDSWLTLSGFCPMFNQTLRQDYTRLSDTIESQNGQMLKFKCPIIFFVGTPFLPW